jgi:hypothetical protein
MSQPTAIINLNDITVQTFSALRNLIALTGVVLTFKILLHKKFPKLKSTLDVFANARILLQKLRQM